MNCNFETKVCLNQLCICTRVSYMYIVLRSPLTRTTCPPSISIALCCNDTTLDCNLPPKGVTMQLILEAVTVSIILQSQRAPIILKLFLE